MVHKSFSTREVRIFVHIETTGGRNHSVWRGVQESKFRQGAEDDGRVRDIRTIEGNPGTFERLAEGLAYKDGPVVVDTQLDTWRLHAVHSHQTQRSTGVTLRFRQASDERQAGTVIKGSSAKVGTLAALPARFVAFEMQLASLSAAFREIMWNMTQNPFWW